MDSRQKYFEMLSNGSLTENLSYYTIYAVNILTNHGKHALFTDQNVGYINLQSKCLSPYKLYVKRNLFSIH